MSDRWYLYHTVFDGRQVAGVRREAEKKYGVKTRVSKRKGIFTRGYVYTIEVDRWLNFPVQR